ncbi:MAG TPA: copper-binding protein, partial [Cyanophyceae cyanobacterium]
MMQLILSIVLGLAVWLGSIGTSPAIAAPGNSLPPTQVTVSLGNSANELKFFPSKLEFVAGQPYKLVLDNPSSQKHY